MRKVHGKMMPKGHDLVYTFDGETIELGDEKPAYCTKCSGVFLATVIRDRDDKGDYGVDFEPPLPPCPKGDMLYSENNKELVYAQRHRKTTSGARESSR